MVSTRRITRAYSVGVIRLRIPAILLMLAAMLGGSGCAPVTDVEVVRLERQLESVLELHTYEHIYRDLVYFGEQRTFLFIKTVDRAVLFSVDIRVRAGIDLSQGVRLEVDRTAADRVTVRLPEATILSVDTDETTIREYFLREQGARIGLLEISGQLKGAKERIAAEAIERGILAEAQANARRLVRGLLEMAGFREIEFVPAVADGGAR